MSINITDAIFAQAERNPDAIAVIDDEGAISYRALCQSLRLAAQRISDTGWKAGDIIGISMHDTPTLHLICQLALARLGIAQVSMLASDPAPRRSAQIARLGIRGMISRRRLDPDIMTLAPDPKWRNAQYVSMTADIRATGGNTLWVINETSGTTATPKAIGLTHTAERAHHERLLSALKYLPGERFLSFVSLHFLSAIKRTLYCLREGATVTLPPPSYSMQQLLNWMGRHQVTFITCVPVHLFQMLRHARRDSPSFPNLRVLRCSSATLAASATLEVSKRISPNIYIDYGCTEVGTVTIATPTMLAANPETIGRPLEGIQFEVVDENNNQVSKEMPGQVRVRGPGVENCYINLMDAGQSSAFREGWFYPGDIVTFDNDGHVFLKGRTDEVMNFDGIMVGPAEIESVLRQHPVVKEIAAFALPSRDHQDIPAAAIVSEGPLPTGDLQRFCAARLGVRAPRVYLRFDEIPKNPGGKVLRRLVVEQALEMLKKQPRPS